MIDWLKKSHRSGLNRRPLDYESSALPLSYCGNEVQLPRSPSALARTRTATPFGTTPSRWRVYQFHHQGEPAREEGGGQRAETSLSLRPPPPALRPSPSTGPTGLEPATSRVTVECSNQTELRPHTLRRTGLRP